MTLTTGKLTDQVSPQPISALRVAVTIPGRRLGQGGYTLVELVVVCALIAIMMAVAVPVMDPGRFSDPLKSAARRTIALVNEVRAAARLAGREHTLNVDPTGGRIWFTTTGKEPQDNTPQEVETVLEMPSTVRIVGLWQGEEDLLSTQQSEVWISGRGYLEELRIVLEDDGGETITLGFAPFHEMVTVSDPELAAEG